MEDLKERFELLQMMYKDLTDYCKELEEENELLKEKVIKLQTND
tara:strand:- start:253 stop:384 length:132 start_codon:yes stop_codon:yes gene_type:complete